ncbi:MAG: M23 family metallopeptidase [Myxococcales bacterium]|nr:MAG: M23 family metallopeptidase [Myxococcales bacterium]
MITLAGICSRKMIVRLLCAAALGSLVPIAHSQNGLTTLSQHSNVTDISQLLGELEILRAEKARIDTEMMSIDTNLSSAKTALRTHTQSLYRLRRAGTLPVAGGFDALLSHSARINRLEKLVAQNLSKLKELSRHWQGLNDRSEMLAGKIANYENQMDTLQFGGGLSLQLPIDSSPNAAAHWDNLDVNTRNAYGAMKQGISFSSASGEASSSYFEQLRGKLAAPVEAYQSVRSAERPESEGAGLEFITSAGAPVYSAANGRVAFADNYGSYGQIVILDHGERYYSVYGGLGSFAVSVGDQVSTGTVIAKLANDTNPAVLFFELRLGTRALDPKLWLNLQ